MPESPDTNLSDVEARSKGAITGAGGTIASTEEVPIAFGLKSLNVIFSMDESKGDTEELENQISSIEGIQSVQVTDVRRAIG